MRIRFSLLFLLLMVSVAHALDFESAINPDAGFSLEALKAEAAKAVPSAATLTHAEGGGAAALVVYTKDDSTYRFSLSGEVEPQVPDAQSFQYRGHDALFYHLGSDSSAALLVRLSPQAGLTVTCTRSYDAAALELKDMKSLVDPIDLGKLKPASAAGSN